MDKLTLRLNRREWKCHIHETKKLALNASCFHLSG